MMSTHQSWHTVGNKIRNLRKSNGLTLKQLARGSGLSVNTISLVERNEVAPTIETLCKIANALGVSPSSLFLEFCGPEVILQRAKEINCETDLTDRTLRLFSSTPQNATDIQSHPHADTTHRLGSRHSILCLCGQVELELDGQNYCLSPGDTLNFNGDTFHRWHNLGPETGIAVLILPPDSSDESQSR